MQGLVYLLIVACGAGLGTAAFFLLGLTPIECILVAGLVIVGGALYQERVARRRSLRRLERGVEEMARLLATDAKAGQILTERVNAMADLDLGPRLDVIEADMSVLGTVVRQVAEAVSDLETAHAASAPSPDHRAVETEIRRRPTIALAEVSRAMDEGRFVHHVQPILTLPQRKVHAYDLVPRLACDGRLADPAEYMPAVSADGDAVVRRIERICAQEAIRIVRRARLDGQALKLLVDISPASLADRETRDEVLSVLSANRAVNPDLAFALQYDDWVGLGRPEADALAAIVQLGASLAIRNATTLRLDFAALAEKGVRYITTSATRFIKTPAALTDFHASDINDYIQRFGLRLVVTHVAAEADILSLLDDGVRLAQGTPLGVLGPLHPDLRDGGEDQFRRLVAQ